MGQQRGGPEGAADGFQPRRGLKPSRPAIGLKQGLHPPDGSLNSSKALSRME